MSRIYEIECHPRNERYRVVRLEAATIEEAMQRADNLWMEQRPKPRLLTIIDPEPIKPLVTFA